MGCLFKRKSDYAMTYPDIPPVAFLGVAERCASVRDGNTNLFKQNILGLKQTILSHIFPLNLGSFHWVLALYTPQSGTEMKLRIKDESEVEVGVINFSLESLKTDEPTIED